MRAAGTMRHGGDHEPPEPSMWWLEMPIILERPEHDGEDRTTLKQPSRVLGGLKTLLLRRER